MYRLSLIHILFPNYVNGVEIFNAKNNQDENDQAYMYAKKYNLPMTAGADNHHIPIVNSGKMCIRDSQRQVHTNKATTIISIILLHNEILIFLFFIYPILIFLC